MTRDKAIDLLEKGLKNGEDLPEDLFFFISRHSPIANIDLIVNNEDGQILLTWRDDHLYGPGWHVPGGVIRFKERWETRIKKVAKIELGLDYIMHEITPSLVFEMVNKRDLRGHFISLGFRCFYSKNSPKIDPKYNAKWFDAVPYNLLECQEQYRNFLIYEQRMSNLRR